MKRRSQCALASALAAALAAGGACLWLVFRDPPAAKRAEAVEAEPFPGRGKWSEPVAGVRGKVFPAKDIFAFGDPVRVRVVVENSGETERRLLLYGNRPASITRSDGEEVEASGWPARVWLVNHRGWDTYLPDNLPPGSRRWITLPAGSSLHFDCWVFELGRRTPVPSGRLSVSVWLGVGSGKDGAPLGLKLPRAETRVLNRKAFEAALKLVEAALADEEVDSHKLCKAFHTLSDNPDPRQIPVMLRAEKHNWGPRAKEWTFKNASELIWRALGQFEDRRIAERAMERATGPALKIHPAADVLAALDRNRRYLERAKILKMRESSWKATVLLARVATEEDLPKLADLLVEHYWAAGGGGDMAPFRKAFLAHPETAKSQLRRQLRKGFSNGKPARDMPGSYLWNRELFEFIVSLLAEMKDQEAIPILEDYGKAGKDWLSRYLAKFDSPAAMKSLRNLGTRSTLERAKLGDPAAIDALLAQLRELRKPAPSGVKTCGNDGSHAMEGLIHSLGCPWDMNVEEWWAQNRPKFVKAFRQKYGFDP